MLHLLVYILYIQIGIIDENNHTAMQLFHAVGGFVGHITVPKSNEINGGISLCIRFELLIFYHLVQVSKRLLQAMLDYFHDNDISLDELHCIGCELQLCIACKFYYCPSLYKVFLGLLIYNNKIKLNLKY